MTRRFIRNPFTLIALVALLALFLNACCGSCGDADLEAAQKELEKEIEKEKAKAEKESKMDSEDIEVKKDKKADKKKDEMADKMDKMDKMDKEEKKADKGSSKLEPITVKDIKPKELRTRLESLGWEVIGEPTEQNQTGMRGVTYPIVKGAKGGAASIYEYKQQNVAKIFDDSMRKQKAATERDGGKVITVLFPGDESLGKEVLDQIMGR